MQPGHQTCAPLRAQRLFYVKQTRGPSTAAQLRQLEESFVFREQFRI